MSERIVIDPITRIEGHLRVEAAIENGKIKDRIQFRYDGTWNRKHSTRPRPTRCLGVRRPCLRRVYPPSTRFARFAPLRMRSASVFRPMPKWCATSWKRCSTCTTIRCISTSCMPSTGSTLFPASRQTRKRPPSSPSSCRRGPKTRKAISQKCKTSSRSSSPAVNWASSPTGIGGTRPTN